MMTNHADVLEMFQLTLPFDKEIIMLVAVMVPTNEEEHSMTASVMTSVDGPLYRTAIETANVAMERCVTATPTLLS